jgi:ADP-ribosyltransferase exoenzyme
VAIPQPEPEDWIKANAQQLRLSDREVLAMLRAAYKEVNKDLAALIANDATGLGSAVRRAQLEATRSKLLSRQASIFENLGDLVSARRLRSAIRAQELSASANAALLNLVGRSDVADFLLRAAGQTSDSAIDVALARMGLSQLPLSKRIYRTQLWMDDRLGKLINATLAAGVDAKSFAKKARDWFNPATPGGVRYAALRLARTEINNAFHAMTAQKAADTPWIPNCEWHLSASHPKKDACNVIAERDTGFGPGVYRSEAVPVRPHPQCMCFITPQPIDEEDFITGFLDGDYDDYLDREIANAPTVDSGPEPAPVAPQRKRQLSFDERVAASAKDLDALAAPTFGLERRPRPAEFKPEWAVAVNRYSSTRYEIINGFLRGQDFEGSRERAEGWVRNLDEAMEASPLRRDTLLYRGIQDASTLFGDRLDGDLTGLEWEEQAYVSTSALERRTKAFLTGQGKRVLLRILADAGTPAIEVSPENAEAEVVLRRGLQLRVVKDHGIRPDGVRILDVELVK